MFIPDIDDVLFVWTSQTISPIEPFSVIVLTIYTLSTNVVPIPTTDALTPFIDVNPFPTFVPVTKIGYPTFNLSASTFANTPLEFWVTALKKNLSAGPPPDLVVCWIPVIIPVYPSTFSIVLIFSVWYGGKEAITNGGFVDV